MAIGMLTGINRWWDVRFTCDTPGTKCMPDKSHALQVTLLFFEGFCAPGILTEIVPGLRVAVLHEFLAGGVGPLPMYNNYKKIRSHQTGRVG